MADIQLEADTNKMRSGANEVEEVGNDYNSLQQRLFEAGRELDKTWSGDANETFDSILKEDEPKFAELYKIINNYAGAIRQSADEYDRNEAAVAEQINSNTSRQSR